MAKIKRVLTDILFNQYIAEQLKPYIDRHDLELAHSLSIEQNSTGKVKVSLLNTKNEVLDSKYFNLPLEKFIKEVKLDYNNKCLVFIRNDETSFSCDISELINDYLNRINWLANAKQDTLISGSNIKTINNISILGSGNIDIDNGANKIKYDDGFTLYKNDTEIPGQTDKVKVKTIGRKSILGLGNIALDTANISTVISGETIAPAVLISEANRPTKTVFGNNITASKVVSTAKTASHVKEAHSKAFNTDAHKATYDSVEECLDIKPATTESINSYSFEDIDCSNVSISDVVVPTVLSNNAVDCATTGQSVQLVAIGSTITVATGSITIED